MSLWANKQSWGLWSVNDRAAGFCQKDQIAVFVTLHEVSLGLDLVIFLPKNCQKLQNSDVINPILLQSVTNLQIGIPKLYYYGIILERLRNLIGLHMTSPIICIQ